MIPSFPTFSSLRLLLPHRALPRLAVLSALVGCTSSGDTLGETHPGDAGSGGQGGGAAGSAIASGGAGRGGSAGTPGGGTAGSAGAAPGGGGQAAGGQAGQSGHGGSAGMPACALAFGPAASFPAGSYPVDVVLVDLDGDGQLDAVVSLGGQDALAVMLGHAGSFGPPRLFATGQIPQAIVTGDFDADGHPDIAVLAADSGTVSVFLGDGKGAFREERTYSLGYGGYSDLALGDFDGDHRLDLIVGKDATGEVYPGAVDVFLGKADGTFAPPILTQAQGLVYGVAVGDLDGDGKSDVVAAEDTNQVTTRLGKGDGTFGPETAVGIDPATRVALRDLDGDGRLDLLVTGGATLHVLLGTGDGTFGPPSSYAAPPSSVLEEMAFGDFDGDTLLDVAASSGTDVAGKTVVVFPGRGDGSFGAATAFDTRPHPAGIAAADLDGDGAPDLVTADNDDPDGTLSVLRNSCSGAVGAGGAGGSAGAGGSGGGAATSCVAEVRVGSGFSCVRTTAGTVSCWGVGGLGSLGNGSLEANPSPVPALLSTPAASLQAGRGDVCVIDASGALFCWGDNGHQQIGDPDPTITIDAERPLPTRVPSLTDVALVAVGQYHMCAARTDGSVFCWGDNAWGLGDPSTAFLLPAPTLVVSLPVAVVALAAGDYHTCAVGADHHAYCWGWNVPGVFGSGTMTDSPVRLPVDIAALGGDVATLAAGATHTCFVKTKGDLLCAGGNGYGELGDGTTTPSAAAVKVQSLPPVLSVAAGTNHTCALTVDHAVLCWGKNDQGELGDGTTTDRHLPTPVVGLAAGVLAITTLDQHSCALLSDSSVRCWGYSRFGEVAGDVMSIDATPVKLPFFPCP